MNDYTMIVLEHKQQVADALLLVIGALLKRAVCHDNSKFSPEEFDEYERVTPRLKGLVYGSQGYRATLQGMQPALTHHYQVNAHHPEHHPDGVTGMNLLDVLEMVCDWRAAARRSGSDLTSGMQRNKERFHIDDQLFAILNNTITFLEHGGEDAFSTKEETSPNSRHP